MYPKKQLAQLVISACKYFEVYNVVLSPGSRNAPLTIGFSNHSDIKTYSIVDERCAAFFALGIAQQTQKPVALVCTSGSALLNYYPAIAEAFYSRIPLIVISADRPKHLIDIGDGQTIRQENVFQNHIGYTANLVENIECLETNLLSVSQAIQIANNKKLPVHINVPFDEPLYDTVETLSPFKFKIEENEEQIKIDYSKYSEIWNNAYRKLILIGTDFPSEKTQEILDVFVEDKSVLVMTETTSNLHHPKFINSIDKLISKLDEDGFKNLQPEVLLTFGGMIVSKRIKQFLRKFQPKHHWHIDKHTKLDTYFCLTEFVKENPVLFLNELHKISQNNLLSDYQQFWLQEKQNRELRHQEFLANTDYSDLKVFELVLKSIPSNSQIQISNSSMIRYAQLFNIKSSLQVFCNRGTSGIDGSTSTAIGASVASNLQTIFITGDLSFFYDSNALWNNYIPENFRIILINNSGGGIFKIIPGPKQTNSLRYFETPHRLTAVHLAKMYNLDYLLASNLNEVNNSLKCFYEEDNRPKILEILTPSDINHVVLQEYFKNL